MKLLEMQVKRSVAKAMGHSHYFTGKPCPKGHISPRRVLNGGCQTCLNDGYKTWRLENHQKSIDATNKWRENNRETLLESRRKFRASLEGKVKLAEQRARLYSQNPEKFQQRARDFYHANRIDCASRNRRYRYSILGFDAERSAKKRVLHAMPVWADRAAIKVIYANCPHGMQVDHFVPLSGRMPDGSLVSGLHVPDNLRYLTAKENSSRKNRISFAEASKLESVLCG